MRMRPGLMLSTLFLALTSISAWGDSPTNDASEDYAKRIRGQQDVSPLGTDLMGDEISTYLGTLSFSNTDVTLPGPGEAPVSLGRRFTLSSKTLTTGHFGDWDLEIPRIQGTFSWQRGWLVGESGSDARCSQYAGPPVASDGSNYGFFDGREYWNGTSLYVPGHGSQEILTRTQQNTLKPTSGDYPLLTTGLWMISCGDHPVKNPRAASSSLPAISGETFVALSPDGTRYTFDWMVSHRVPGIAKAYAFPASRPNDPVPNVSAGGYTLARAEYWMLPTRVEDRFGNWVDYAYNVSEPWKLDTITAKDGRRIKLTYYDGTTRIKTVEAGHLNPGTDTFLAKRTWNYIYSAGGALTSVELPDHSHWDYVLGALASAHMSPAGGPPSCDRSEFQTTTPSTGTITHPSGAIATFKVQPTHHGRSWVEKSCDLIYTTTSTGESVLVGVDNRNPREINQLSIVSKEISGPGLVAPLTWIYQYGSANASWSAGCTSCEATKTVDVIDPEGHKVHYTFGNREAVNEGQLLKTETFQTTSSVTPLRTEVFSYATATEVPNIPQQPSTANGIDGFGESSVQGGDHYMSTHILPQKQRTISQDGVDFTWKIGTNVSGNLDVDVFGNPLTVARTSTLGYSKNEAVAYDTNFGKWVLGLKKQLTNTKGPGTADDIVELKNTYDPATSLVQTVEQFGRTVASMTYAADGSLSSKTDGNNHRTDFNNYKAGIPREIKFHDLTSQTAVVDDLGQITAISNEKQETTTYQYDDIGRLKRVIYPTGDTVAWADTTNTFNRPGTNDFALGGNQWVQTVSTGNGVKQVYYDGLFRPAVTVEYDSTNATQANATARYTLRAFDSQGHTTYTSYPFNAPVRPSDPGFSYYDRPKGSYASFDALGRTVETSADSEYGTDATTRLTTKTEYLAGLKRKVTDPLLHISTTEFQAFDEPSYDAPVKITAPLGVTVEIGRDEYGKPSSIKRFGNWTNAAGQVQPPLAQTRWYYYDSAQRLCKAIDPESGATFTHYDLADNVDWTASSKNQLVMACDRDTLGGALDASKVIRRYDVRNRLLQIDYPDATSDIVNTYYPDGKLWTTTTGGSVWSYDYNQRGLLWRETLTIDNRPFSAKWDFNSNGHLNSITYPGESWPVDLAPNALGQPTQVGIYAGKVHYLPNGAVDTFEYGNRVAHSMTPNARQLPSESKDTLGSNVLLDDVYTYDRNGNVKTIVDQALQGASSRSMTYDDLDRLVGVDAPNLWGTINQGTDARYVYDSLDNLRTAKVGTSTKTFTIDGNNRLTEVIGNPGFSLSYDDQGNVKTRGTQNFTFDLANRMISATVLGSDNQPRTETYTYDGHGRRTSLALGNAPKRYQMYSNAGQLLYERDLLADTTTLYYYLGNSLVARKDYAPVLLVNQRNLKTLGGAAPPFGAPFALTWDASPISSAPRYELESSRDDSNTWTPYSGAINRPYTVDPEGGSYLFRVRGCNDSTLACEPWSYLGPVGVMPKQAAFTAVPSSAAGSFTVQWTVPQSTTRFELEESFNGGVWVAKQLDAPLATSFVAAPDIAGGYAYRVKAYNVFGARDWAVSTAVSYTPAALCRPQVSVDEANNDPNYPAWHLSIDGTYTVSWSCSGGGINSYQFIENDCGQDITQTSSCVPFPPVSLPASTLSKARVKSTSGLFKYQVRACSSAVNSAAPVCGPISLALQLRVARADAPPAPTGLTITPNPAPFGMYTVSWNASSDPAVVYELYEGVGTNPEVRTAVTLPAPNATSVSIQGKINGSYRYLLFACKVDVLGNRVCGNPNSSTEVVQHDVSFYLSLFDDDENGTTNPNNHTPSSTGPELNLQSPYRLATLKYYHTDALGSPVLVTNEGGGIDGTRRYYQPYGAPTDGSYQNGPGYTGHVTDTLTQLTYAQQRYYDPALGRFLSVDPESVEASLAANFNRYAYASNNPFKNIDPTGRVCESANQKSECLPAYLETPEAARAAATAAVVSVSAIALWEVTVPVAYAVVTDSIASGVAYGVLNNLLRIQVSAGVLGDAGLAIATNGYGPSPAAVEGAFLGGRASENFLGRTPSEVRTALAERGAPGIATAGGTAHAASIDGRAVQVRVMDGTTAHGPRVVISSQANVRQRVDPTTGKPFGNGVPIEEQQAMTHFPLNPDK